MRNATAGTNTSTAQESPLRLPPSLSRAGSSTLSDAAAGLPMPSLRQSVSYTHGVPINRQQLALQQQQQQQQGQQQQQQQDEWRASLTAEERAGMRKHIHEAFTKHAQSFDDVLELAIALQEEALYALSASRLDYIKDSVQFEKRLVATLNKKKEEEGEGGGGGGEQAAATEVGKKKKGEEKVKEQEKGEGNKGAGAAGSKGRPPRRGAAAKVEEKKEEEEAAVVESSHKRKKPRK